MKKIIYNRVFNRRKTLNADGEALVQVEAYQEGKKIYFSTNVYLKPYQWDPKKKKVKNHPNARELNQVIDKFVCYLETLEIEIIECERHFPLDKQKLRDPSDTPASFLLFMEKEIAKADLRASTRKNHLTTWKHLSYYCPDMRFEDLTYDFLCDFEHYLLARGYHRNTIAKHMKHLKRYVNLAINKEMFLLQKYPFHNYHIKQEETKRCHLTPEELSRLESTRLALTDLQQKVLDMFLFCCYTGLRFSDATNITGDNFCWIDHSLWLIYSSIKTKVSVRLPLYLLFEGKAIPIYEKYKKCTTEKLFGVSASENSNMNQCLKTVCALVGIEKNVSFHAARHTNATLLLYNGVNITTVQKLLGHRSVKTTEIYSNIMDMTVVRDLKNMYIK